MGQRTFLAIGVLGIVTLALAPWVVVGQAPTPEPPTFVAGQRYLVLYHGSCVPEWMGQVAQGVLRIPQALNPCYGEVIEVTAVRRDGWLVATVDGESWTINAASIAAFRAEAQTQRARSRLLDEPTAFASPDVTALGALRGRHDVH